MKKSFTLKNGNVVELMFTGNFVSIKKGTLRSDLQKIADRLVSEYNVKFQWYYGFCCNSVTGRQGNKPTLEEDGFNCFSGMFEQPVFCSNIPCGVDVKSPSLKKDTIIRIDILLNMASNMVLSEVFEINLTPTELKIADRISQRERKEYAQWMEARKSIKKSYLLFDILEIDNKEVLYVKDCFDGFDIYDNIKSGEYEKVPDFNGEFMEVLGLPCVGCEEQLFKYEDVPCNNLTKTQWRKAVKIIKAIYNGNYTVSEHGALYITSNWYYDISTNEIHSANELKEDDFSLIYGYLHCKAICPRL